MRTHRHHGRNGHPALLAAALTCLLAVGLGALGAFVDPRLTTSGSAPLFGVAFALIWIALPLELFLGLAGLGTAAVVDAIPRGPRHRH